MNTPILHRISRLSLFIALIALLAACTDPKLLSEPRVGDIYAAELTHFESFKDERGKLVETGYGLLRVTRVKKDRIEAITTNWYNDSKRGAERELKKYQRLDQWATGGEHVTILRADLPKLHDENKIFAIYRREQ